MYRIAKDFAAWLSKQLSSLLIILLIGLRPLLGPAHCKFTVSCTEFAIIKLKEGPLFHALWEIFKRLLRCSPFYNRFD